MSSILSVRQFLYAADPLLNFFCGKINAKRKDEEVSKKRLLFTYPVTCIYFKERDPGLESDYGTFPLYISALFRAVDNQCKLSRSRRKI